jgi:hypothetical protein
MITKKTATDIWCAHDEIEKGTNLLAQMEEFAKRGDLPDLRDAFGRARNLQLGVPSGENATRLFDVHPNLATAVIKAHIAEKRNVLIALNELAKQESLQTE